LDGVEDLCLAFIIERSEEGMEANGIHSRVASRVENNSYMDI
jgi:hypothetical protein